jgi:hypothetical protein
VVPFILAVTTGIKEAVETIGRAKASLNNISSLFSMVEVKRK